uniref:Glutathione S-transferase omega 2 n=1 Tax=Hucho hucho TaxID=62062 RepID=A0A4W5NP76_9TELE
MASEKCFAKGSSAPGLVAKGQIRLYSMRFCPFAHRTRLVLHAKGINHDTVNINLKDKPEWFLKKNPLGLVPTLETSSGQVIYESPITCDYLDEVYTENDAGEFLQDNTIFLQDTNGEKKWRRHFSTGRGAEREICEIE